MAAGLYYDLPHGISVIDTAYHRAGFDASYLIEAGASAAFVDVGTAFSVPRLLKVLADKNLAPAAVDYVMVTHVHLDHAGGAGVLMRHLPNARLVVHPRGASHMIDPHKLIAGATTVYGEAAFTRLYGEVAPIAAERVLVAEDGWRLAINGRELLFLDTPGHARHHYSIYDETSRGIFSGDTFGLSYREFDTARGPFIFPTTTPVQFEPEALHASIERLLSLQPERVYLTHYGCLEDPQRLATRLHALIDQFVACAQAVSGTGAARQEALEAGVLEILGRALSAHGCALSGPQLMELLEVDVRLNAQGLAVWLDRQQHTDAERRDIKG